MGAMENKLKLILDNGVMVLVTGDYKLQIEANNGWFDLINDLCNEINTIYITNDREEIGRASCRERV